MPAIWLRLVYFEGRRTRYARGMKASALEYRFRFLIHAVIFGLGFGLRVGIAPGPNAHVWGTLSAMLSEAGVMTIGAAFDGLLVVGIVCAGLGAWLRTWGAAYLGSGVVQAGGMHTGTQGDGVIADGPYRYVRNPLYLGTILHTLALALLMPVVGACVCVVLIVVFQVRLILREEPFLRETLGSPYVAYCGRVPRLMPALRAKVPEGGAKAAWGQAFVGEIYFWGAAGSFAVAGWGYNAALLMRCVIVSLGVSLVAMGFVGKKA